MKDQGLFNYKGTVWRQHTQLDKRHGRSAILECTSLLPCQCCPCKPTLPYVYSSTNFHAGLLWVYPPSPICNICPRNLRSAPPKPFSWFFTNISSRAWRTWFAKINQMPGGMWKWGYMSCPDLLPLQSPSSTYYAILTQPPKIIKLLRPEISFGETCR